MDVLVIAGFLGSGKTTMILSTIGKLIGKSNKKVAIIVNDFGKIGIDGKVMDKYGLKVQELSSGCICCTLGPDFIQTLKQVAENFKPDIVIVEPTGIADPQSILNSLGYYTGPPVAKTKTVVIVDSVRFSVLVKALERPLKAQVKAADVVIINKIDEVDDLAVKDIERALRNLHVSGSIVAASATEGTNLDKVVDLLVK
ncbi:MAG: GTP-binding protein [Methanomassiliicoccales archaeon]|jgi:G3E family GTPase